MVTNAIMGSIAFVASLQTQSTYASVVYTAPFVVLFVLALGMRFKTASSGKVIPAAIGAAVPITLYHCLFLYDIWVRLPNEGGGANIGLGILLVFLMPFIILVSMVAGWVAGAIITERSRSGEEE